MEYYISNRACRIWDVRSLFLPMKLFVVVVVVISTLTFLVDASSDIAGVDAGTTNASISTDSSSETDIIKPVIKKQRAWTLFHRILPSTTNNEISEKIHLSSLEWVRRGTINLTIIDPKLASDEPVSLEIINDEDALNESFIDDIRLLDSITNTTTWYQLKIVDDTSKSDDPSLQQQLLTSVPSCSVLRSNFRDEILIQFQSVRNSNIISITYIPYISRFAPKKCMDYIPIVASSTTTTPAAVASSTTPTSTSNETAMNQTKYQFISKISWETAVPGMIVGKPQLLDPTTNLPIVSATNMKIKPPPGYHWFPNSISNRRNSASGSSGGGGKGTTPNDNDDENSDEQAKQDSSPFGFFKKYYYIFIPLMVLNLINSMNPPPPPSASSQQESGGSNAAGTPGRAAAVVAGTTAAAATTTTAGPGQVRQRRGKKD